MAIQWHEAVVAVAGRTSSYHSQWAMREVGTEVVVWGPCLEDCKRALMEGVELVWGREE